MPSYSVGERDHHHDEYGYSQFKSYSEFEIRCFFFFWQNVEIDRQREGEAKMLCGSTRKKCTKMA